MNGRPRLAANWGPRCRLPGHRWWRVLVRLVGLVFGLAPRAIGRGVDSFKALA
jgi:hypothetical protein